MSYKEILESIEKIHNYIVNNNDQFKLSRENHQLIIQNKKKER